MPKAEQWQPLRLPIGDPRREAFEANPASPILRFATGHALEIGGLFAGKQTGEDNVGLPLSYVQHPQFAPDGKITSYTLELTGEELAQMVITASADPALQTTR
ncbi:MAG: hypothetical protein KGL95_07175, partial [Patescibacteria group bacterium]|nr:hypothetical protein [Patescibacteria group bacterium]